MSAGQLLDAVRQACPSGLWSQGVKLARQGAVSQESEAAGEIVLRVAISGRAVAPTVVLYPDDGEWECSCSSKYDACAHVAAGVIALSEAGPGVSDAPVLAYRFERLGQDLILRRVIANEGKADIELPVSVMTIAAGRGGPKNLNPTQPDLAVDRVLSGMARTEIKLDQVGRIFEQLSGCTNITLDGEPCLVAGEELLPQASVKDHKRGVRLAVEVARPLREVIGPGVGVVGKGEKQTLVPLGHTSVAGDRWQYLPIVRDYEPEELGHLATEMLPAVARDVDVEIKTNRLPRAERGHLPRLHFAFESDGETLSVMPTLVYGDPPLARIDGDRMVQLRSPAPVRNRDAERDLVVALRERLNMMPGRKVEVSGSDARKLADKVRSFQRGEDLDALAAAVLNIELAPILEIENRDDGGTAFELWFETPEDGAGEKRRIAGSEVMAAWRNRVGVVPLGPMGWAPVPEDFLSKYGQQVLDLLIARNESHTISRAALPQLARLCDELSVPRPRAADQLAKQLARADKNLPPVKGFRGDLRGYQKAGVSWLAARRDAELGAVLADDMGLGKTVQALAVVPSGTLIVCPTSVVPNWAAEIDKFRPGSSVCVYHGANRQLDPEADFVLTSYALLRIDRDALCDRSWNAVILDEAQAIKNPDSQTARAAYALEGKFHLALSGTPVENRLDELWSVCHAILPGLLGERRDFQRRYVTPIAAKDAEAAAHLHERIGPFVLRRRKKEVAPELPPRTDSVLYVELEADERAVYDSVQAAARDDLVARLTKGASALEILEALLRLRQAACHPSLVPGQSAEISSKVACLLESLETAAADGHKALVFSQWTSFLDLIEPHMKSAGIDFLRLDGSTRDRAGVVKGFQSDDGPPVLLASLKAGGTGLNLTAADHVFIVDPWWNPAVEEQAADRAHRIGQDKPVMVYRLIAKDTVEERIEALKQRKRDLADTALGGATAAITRDDLADLL